MNRSIQARASFASKLLASTLATLLAWAPMAPIARADDRPIRESQSRSHALDSNRAAQIEESAAAGDGLAVDGESLERAIDEAEREDAPASDDPATETEDQTTPIALPGAEARTAVTPQAISLPSAEGSVEGMGESFSPILSSGTATFSVPIAVAPGRRGVQPSLALSYSSTSGNGPVGFGWNLGVPFIARQTDRGLPRYVDGPTWTAEEDRFLYNGGQELVPVDSASVAAVDGRASDGVDASAVPNDVRGWQQYRARVEGAFMRFFRSPDSNRWVVQSRDGTRFDFGMLPEREGPAEVVSASIRALEYDPESTASEPRVFRWALTRMSDAHGSTVYYRYRSDRGQSYLEDIHYVSPATCAAESAESTRECPEPLANYGARIRFVYGDRPDVFSSYVSGWKVETALRLVRVEVTAWNSGPSVQARTLVRRYHLRYDPSAFHSLLAEVQVEGRPEDENASLGVAEGRDDVAEGALTDLIVGRVLPPMRFGYSTMPSTGNQVEGFGGVDITIRSVENSPPHSLDEPRADLYDVNTDGLPDLIVTDPARYNIEGQPAVGVFFNGFRGDDAAPAGRAASFSGRVRMPMDRGMATTLSLLNPNVVPMDIDGDGRSDLLHMPRQSRYGWFTPTRDVDRASTAVSPASQGWRWTYAHIDLPRSDTDPRIDLARDSSHLETVDVNNDHLIDVVRTTGTSMQTWVNLGWLPGGDGRFGSYEYVDGAWQLSTEPFTSCLLRSDGPLNFESPEIRIAEMNGDGLLDIVEVQWNRVRYWPGRGEASWGEGPYGCSGFEGGGRYIEMSSPPARPLDGFESLQLMDVNADGVSDMVQVRADAVDVWFNRAGSGFTPRLTARGTPALPAFSPRARFADIDGSATTDIVWGTASNWRYVDLAGGQRPRLLVRVENGLGAQTDIEYGSSAEDYVADLEDAASCTQCDRFPWGRVEGAPSARLTRRAGGVRAWHSAGSPVISTVVRSVSTSDRLNVLGREAQVSTTRFAYHDGYYEGIEQEFRGFGAADAVSVGDWNHPTSYTRTFFHQGRRPQSIADDRLADNPFEALKGREYLTETFDERGVYLSSAHASLTSRDLFRGLDGRWIQYAFVSEANELRYDTAAWTVGREEIELNDVAFEEWSASQNAWTRRERDSVTRRVLARGAHYALLRTTFDVVDSLGQVRQQTLHGSVGGVWTDSEAIRSHTRPALVNAAEWIWRTASTSLSGLRGTTVSGPYRETVNDYDAVGDLKSSRQVVTTPAVYEFKGEVSTEGAALAQLQTNAGIDDDIIASSRNDAWGNALASCVGADISGIALTALASVPQSCLRYGQVSYDPEFAQLAMTETAHVATTGVTTLTTSGTWDRGLGAVRSAADPNALAANDDPAKHTTSVAYDGLGRLVALVPPPIEDCPVGRPTTRLRYELTDDGRAMPLSRIIATTELDCRGALGEDGRSLVAMSYVDGLGRARASLSTGDAPGRWIRSGMTTLDAKGTVRRAYQPDEYVGDEANYRSVISLPTTPVPERGFPAFGPNDIPYTVARYDAFGRPIGAHAEDGSYTSQSHHALSVDVCDALDNDSSSGFYRTCTTSRSDGHGRVIDQILRTYDPQTGAPEQHRLWSYYRADGVVTDLVRARSSALVRPELGSVGNAAERWVHRVFHYDTIGRRIGTDDPDTDSRASGATSANRTWRYLFNRVGDLAAVRDPRGCGQNFFYDLAGRLIGEQYVSCAEAVSGRAEFGLYTVPIGSISMVQQTAARRVDVRYWYDANPPAFTTIPNRGGGVLGRATGVNDRAHRAIVAYDARGNAVWTARQLAYLPDASALVAGPSRPAGDTRPSWTDAPIAANRTTTYATSQTYVRRAQFDHAGRGVALVLPQNFGWASGWATSIGGTLTFNRRGLPASATATVGCDPIANPAGCTPARQQVIAREIEYERDGQVRATRWGAESLGVESTTQYDVRRRPVRMRTTRNPTGTDARSLAAVSTVVDQQLVWDAASNLTEIIDHRDPTEWQPGHRPQSTFVTHDALYRVISASFSYTQESGTRTTADDPTDWRDSQRAIVNAGADPMEVDPARMLQDPAHLPGRVVDLEWNWDWLGNMTRWDDDAGVFYERSIGAISNGADRPASESLRPSALYIATNLPSTGTLTPTQEQRAGWTELTYGNGGNVTEMTVHGQCHDRAPNVCSDLPSASPSARAGHIRSHCECDHEQHYQYRWDELNRLAEARRWDRNVDLGDLNWTLKVRQRYRYDGSNVRLIKAAIEPTSETDAGPPGAHDERIALYPYPGDYELRGFERAVGANQYVAGEGDRIESQYVIAGARLVWRNVTGAEALQARNRRLTVPLSDLIQTTAATLDVVSGELVEASTYYPNGARETLIVDETDPSATEPTGFTGKEGEEEVGLVYFGERYLIARAGRWASADPLHVHAAGGGDALNAFHYVDGTLLQARDPLGLDALDDAASAARARFGIPGVGVPHRARDGWRVTQVVNGHERVRYIGLIRRGPEGNELLVRRTLAVLETADARAHLAEARRAMPRVDAALVLAIGSREGSPESVLSDRSSAICSYHRGGLDDLYGSRDSLPLPAGVRGRLRPASDRPRHGNEHGAVVEPADVQMRDLYASYAAYVQRAGERFESAVREVFGADAQAMLDSVSVDARRAWTQLAFGRPNGVGYTTESREYGKNFGLVTALQRVRSTGDGLESIFTDDWLGEFHGVMRARVTAAEASMLDQFAGSELSEQPAAEGEASSGE